MTEFSFGITSVFSLSSIIPLATLGVYIFIIVITFDCIWRVEHRINLFLKFILCAILITTLRIILGLVGLSESKEWSLVLLITDLVKGLFYLAAMVVMFRMIRSKNSEKSLRK